MSPAYVPCLPFWAAGAAVLLLLSIAANFFIHSNKSGRRSRKTAERILKIIYVPAQGLAVTIIGGLLCLWLTFGGADTHNAGRAIKILTSVSAEIQARYDTLNNLKARADEGEEFEYLPFPAENTMAILLNDTDIIYLISSDSYKNISANIYSLEGRAAGYNQSTDNEVKAEYLEDILERTEAIIDRVNDEIKYLKDKFHISGNG